MNQQTPPQQRDHQAPPPAPAPTPTPKQDATRAAIVGRIMTRDARTALPSASKRSADQVNTRLAEMRERKDMRRSSSEAFKVDAEARTVDLSFSSTTEVKRWFGVEILDHRAGAMEVDRLQARAPLLWDHNWSDQRGVVMPDTVRLDGERARATVKFSRSADGEELMQDVADGIKTNVSVGYRVLDAVLIEVRDDDTEVWLVTRWAPYEISFVSVPADIDVGVGRSAANPQEEPRDNPAQNPQRQETRTSQPTTQGNSSMKIVTLRNGAGHLVRAEVEDDGKTIIKELEVIERASEATTAAMQNGTDAERKRVRTLNEMADKYAKAVPTAAELARKAIQDGTDPDAFSRSLLDAMHQRSAAPLSEQSRSVEIGMSEEEVGRFSFVRAIRALAPNASRADKEAAAFEFEVSAEAGKRYGKEAAGIMVPAEVLNRADPRLVRAFNAGGAANSPAGAQSGALLVPNSVLWGSFIDMLRNKTTIMRLATVMGGLSGTVDIPKQTGGATGYWLGEGEDTTETGITLGQNAMSPKTVGAYSDITRRLLNQGSPDAEGMVRRDLAIALSQTIDKAGYYGSGSDKQPRGLKNYTGINGVDFAAVGGSGGNTWAAPTFAELVQMETEIAADNADIGQMGYVGHTRFRGHCKTALKFASAGSSTLWEAGNTVNGYRTEITNQVNANDVFFGNFADFIVGMWGGLDLTVDPYSLSKSGGLRIVVFQDVDMTLRRLESICWGSADVA